MFGGESATHSFSFTAPAFRGYYLLGSDEQYGPGENCTAADPVTAGHGLRSGQPD